MGMYTEIYVNVDFKEDTPPDFIEVIDAVVSGNTQGLDLPGRWSHLFSNGSYYTPRTCTAKLTHDEIGGYYSLIGKGDIKNYEREIEDFFHYISPWVEQDGEVKTFIGYHRYESDDEPTLVYV